MPDIPKYEHQSTFPVTPLPKAPMHNPALEALTKAGATAEAIGQKFGERELELKRTSEAIERNVDFSVKLMDLRRKTQTSPEFFDNPTATSNAFAEQTKQLQAQYLQSIKDPTEQVMFKKHAATESLHAMGEMSSAAVNQELHRGLSRAYEGISGLARLADNAPTEDEAQRRMGEAQAYFNVLRNQGILKPEEAAQHFDKWVDQRIENRALVDMSRNPQKALDDISNGRGIYSRLDDPRKTVLTQHAQSAVDHQQVIADRQAADQAKRDAAAAYDNAQSKVYDAYHLRDKNAADIGGMTSFLGNPSNQFALGITDEQAQKLISHFNTNQKLQDEAEVKSQKAAGDLLMNQAISGKITADQVETFKDKKGIEPPATAKENAIRWMNSDENQKNRTDPELYARLVTDIDARKITNKDDLNQYAANGLGKGDYQALRNHIDNVADPDKERDIKYASEAFKMKYAAAGIVPDNIDIVRLYPRFITQYEQGIREQGIKGMQTHELADKMLADIDKTYIKAMFGGLKLKTNVPAGDFAKDWGSWPTPTIAKPAETPAQSTGPKPDPAISKRVEELSGKYTSEQVSGFLKEKGIDPGLYGLKPNE